jgi:hypothetical protein
VEDEVAVDVVLAAAAAMILVGLNGTQQERTVASLPSVSSTIDVHSAHAGFEHVLQQ